MVLFLHNAALCGMLCCVLLFQNTWLEMRVNLGFLFFALTAAFLAMQAFVRPLRRLFCSSVAAVLILTAAPLGCWFVLGQERFPVIPASIIREGLHHPRLPFRTINAAMTAFWVVGWLLLSWKIYHKHEF